MAIVIIHGPQASGKTRYSQFFRKHYRCRRIIDGWDQFQALESGDLALTTEEPPFAVPGAKVVAIKAALKAIGK